MTVYQIIEVFSVQAVGVPDQYLIDMAFSIDGTEYRSVFGSVPDDQFGMGPVVRQWLVDHEGEYTILPYVAPPPVPYDYQINVLWTRLTDDEAEEFDAASTTASPLKMRKQFATATSMLSTGELFAWVKTLLINLFGSDRAEDLLADEMLRAGNGEEAPTV